MAQYAVRQLFQKCADGTLDEQEQWALLRWLDQFPQRGILWNGYAFTAGPQYLRPRRILHFRVHDLTEAIDYAGETVEDEKEPEGSKEPEGPKEAE